jgi:hypothetical protein
VRKYDQFEVPKAEPAVWAPFIPGPAPRGPVPAPPRGPAVRPPRCWASVLVSRCPGHPWTGVLFSKPWRPVASDEIISPRLGISLSVSPPALEHTVQADDRSYVLSSSPSALSGPLEPRVPAGWPLFAPIDLRRAALFVEYYTLKWRLRPLAGRACRTAKGVSAFDKEQKGTKHNFFMCLWSYFVKGRQTTM